MVYDGWINKGTTLLTDILYKKPSGSRGKARRALTKRVDYYYLPEQEVQLFFELTEVLIRRYTFM